MPHITVIALFLLLSNCAFAADKEAWGVNYAPLVIGQDGQETTQGTATKVVQAVAKRANLTISVRVMPFSRVLLVGAKQPGQLLFPVIRNAEREALFDWIGPVTHYNYVIYKRKGENIPPAHQISDLKNYTIGVLANDAMFQYLQKNQITNAQQTSSLEQMLRMHAAKRFDLVSGSPAGIRYALKLQGRSMAELEPVFEPQDISLYPFSYLVIKKDSDPQLVARLRRAFAELSQSGEWDQYQAPDASYP